MDLPKKEDYDFFVNNLGNLISENFPDVCFFVYGSYIGDNCTFGRSDIDGAIILNNNFVTDKKAILKMADFLADSNPTGNIEFDFNLTDRGINKDGRFLSYTSDFKEYFNENSKIICGPDYKKEMRLLNHKDSCLHAMAFNLRKIRNGLLECKLDMKRDPERFKKNSRKSFEILSNTPRKLLWLLGYDIIPCKSSSLSELQKILDIDYSTIEKANSLLKNPEEFSRVNENIILALQFYQNNLTALESLFFAYAQKFPEVSDREAKTRGEVL